MNLRASSQAGAVSVTVVVAILLISCVAVLSALGIFTRHKAAFLPGATTDGHHQLEFACATCHQPFKGVSQESCVGCHGAALSSAHDSHANTKFEDPRNAELTAIFPATRCVTCHGEHHAEDTRPMGVTIPADFCRHCHAKIGEERPSHRSFTFEGCSAVGCHKYHDNRATYEDFLLKHLDEPKLKEATKALALTGTPRHGKALTAADLDTPTPSTASAALVSDWAASAHAEAGVNCSDCHATSSSGAKSDWLERPSQTLCTRCHGDQADAFKHGMHGMRAAANLRPMTPSKAHRPMHAENETKALTCEACHQSHRYDTTAAGNAACVRCHADDHSTACERGVHAKLWKAAHPAADSEADTAAPAQDANVMRTAGASCATCHLPRVVRRGDDEDKAVVEHNQNANLRPIEQMATTVCLGCHGLGFSLDALADPSLAKTCYSGLPTAHVDSLDMARKRQQDKERAATPAD